MIALFTDYGLEGPYLGQIEAVLHKLAPRERVINLMADVPAHNVRAGACLLAAVSKDFPNGTIFFCVVDPGVGSFQDTPVALQLDGRWFVGPDNGIFDIAARRAKTVKCREITWRPERLSSSFHGRDLYAPVCAMLANGRRPRGKATRWTDRHIWPDDLAQVIYIDRFGNCVSGVRAGILSASDTIRTGSRRLRHATTFAAVRKGQPFWYENSIGLVEIAVNRGSASRQLGLRVGSRVG